MATTAAASENTSIKPAAPDAHRDPRLDFFRGLGMFIILIAHIPWNGWNNWIPARFGYSDATEIFVFCSGAASAIAFMKVFEKRGWAMGTARVSYRIWQIYWCHIGLFFGVTTALILVDGWLQTGGYYLANAGLPPFSQYGNDEIVGIMLLGYVPNFFDILVMYVVILALMPVVAALALESRAAAIAFVVALYLAASQPWIAVVGGSQPLFRVAFSIALALGAGGLTAALMRNLATRRVARVAGGAVGALALVGMAFLWTQPSFSELQNLDFNAEPWGQRSWFFNPFAWQLAFFTGFAFANGWLPKPPINRTLMLIAAAVLLISFPLDPDGTPAFRLLNGFETLHPLRDALREVRADLTAVANKTYFGVLRYIHFLALAYLVWALAGERGAHLPSEGVGGRFVTVVRRVGQQSLAVFVASLLIAKMLGVWIRETSAGSIARPEDPNAYASSTFFPDFWHTLAANLVGFALLILVAYVARFFRQQPWRVKRT